MSDNELSLYEAATCSFCDKPWKYICRCSVVCEECAQTYHDCEQSKALVK